MTLHVTGEPVTVIAITETGATFSAFLLENYSDAYTYVTTCAANNQ